jgi:hypothetical protein
MGGQPVFHSLLHLFITKYSMYLIVFNLETLVPSASEKTRQEALYYLQFWINSVIVHTYDDVNKTTAPIIFVGTHKEKVPDPSDHEAVNTVLYELIESNAVALKVIRTDRGTISTGRATLQFFAVDNKELGSNDPVMQLLMSEITRFLSTAPYVTQLKPLSWIKFYDTIRGMKSTSHISFEEAVQQAASLGIPAVDVEDLLSFMHQMSVLMWFRDPGLRGIVILNPMKFFVVAATSIIRKHEPLGDDKTHHISPLHQECERKLRNEWRLLLRAAVLDSKLLAMLLSPWAEHTVTITQLMIKFGLLVAFASENDNSTSSNSTTAGAVVKANTRYLVPALLP